MAKKSSSSLCVVAAGSGGHIIPALTLAHQWQQKHPTAAVHFLTSNKSLDTQIATNYPWIDSTTTYSLINLPGAKLWRYPLFCWQFVATFIKAYFFMWQHKPSRIISTGGLLAIPICIAAWLHGVKIGLYELNVVPGKATRLLARWATTLFITFEDSRAHFGKHATKCVLTEYPARFSHEDLMTNKETARENINTMIQNDNPNALPFVETRKTIFVLGGSQGSAFLNDLIKQWAVANPDELGKVQIIHQAGNQARNACEAFYAEQSVPALVFGYHHHIQDCYTLADVVISRAGAGTLFELAFFKKNSLIIPLAGHADNHQIYNAQAIQQNNPTIFEIFNQSSVTQKPQEFFKTLNAIINNTPYN